MLALIKPWLNSHFFTFPWWIPEGMWLPITRNLAPIHVLFWDGTNGSFCTAIIRNKSEFKLGWNANWTCQMHSGLFGLRSSHKTEHELVFSSVFGTLVDQLDWTKLWQQSLFPFYFDLLNSHYLIVSYLIFIFSAITMADLISWMARYSFPVCP